MAPCRQQFVHECCRVLAKHRDVGNLASRAALVTPYTHAYQSRLNKGLHRLGIVGATARHAGIADNLAFAEIGPQDVARMIREAVRGATRPDCVVTWCSNLAAADVNGGGKPAGAAEEKWTQAGQDCRHAKGPDRAPLHAGGERFRVYREAISPV